MNVRPTRTAVACTGDRDGSRSVWALGWSASATDLIPFDRMVAELVKPDGATGAAIDAGFFDQSHMSHEFRALAATTPARYPAQAGSLDRLFADS